MSLFVMFNLNFFNFKVFFKSHMKLKKLLFVIVGKYAHWLDVTIRIRIFGNVIVRIVVIVHI